MHRSTARAQKHPLPPQILKPACTHTHTHKNTHTQGIYLVAEDEDSADAWADALLLASYIARTRSEEALAEALQPATAPGHHR